MQLPFFFEEAIPASGVYILSEESSRHIVQVLRMTAGEDLLITNGKGYLFTATLEAADKKGAGVRILNRSFTAKPSPEIFIGISLIKNKNRFEWFLEKATEIGVAGIIPFIGDRTEKPGFRPDRMKTIMISALLQSRQVWLPGLRYPEKFREVLRAADFPNKYIAHCLEDEKKYLAKQRVHEGKTLVLIGPEGDFTDGEIEEALHHKFIPVSLGPARLRTETAGIVAAVLLLNSSV